MEHQTSAKDSSFRKDRAPLPEAQGQAALLLVESLIHSLIDNGALTKEQAIEAIESASDVKEESASEHKEPNHILRRSLGLLQAMRDSIDAKEGRYNETPPEPDR
jgi:hypothetical protein